MNTIAIQILLCMSVGARQGLPVRWPDPAAEERIQQVIGSLPSDSTFRGVLEGGSRGDGIHYPWMDRMREVGVKRAEVRTQFEWRGHVTNVRVTQILYFSSYDTACSQIRDPRRLKEILESRLPNELEQAAVKATEKARWVVTIDEAVRPSRSGVCDISFLDDEWLPALPPQLTRIPDDADSLIEAALRGDQEEVERQIRQGVSRLELSQALWPGIVYGDTCMTRLLLKAGADVNAPLGHGDSPLISAVQAKKPSIVIALLEAGANLNARDRAGHTALWWARQHGYGKIAELLIKAGAKE